MVTPCNLYCDSWRGGSLLAIVPLSVSTYIEYFQSTEAERWVKLAEACCNIQTPHPRNEKIPELCPLVSPHYQREKMSVYVGTLSLPH